MYLSRLHEWGIRKYSSAETKDLLCEKLLYDFSHGRDISYMAPDWIKKLLRHCKEKRPNADPKLLELLRSLEDSVCSTGNTNHLKNRAPPLPYQLYDDLAVNQILTEWSLRANDSALPNERTYHDSDSGASEVSDSSDVETRDPSSKPVGNGPPDGSATLGASTPTQSTTSASEFEASTLSRDLPPSLVNQFAKIADEQSDAVSLPSHLSLRGRAVALEELLHLTRTYYISRLKQHLLRARAADSSNASLEYHQPKSFWSSVKSAIYFLKKRNLTLAFPILQAAGMQVPELCKTQPLSLLRELLTTLSVVNTSICPGLRGELLRLAARSAHHPEHSENLLHTICVRLQEGWVCDEALTTALCVALRTAEDALGPNDDEIFELRRARIQLLRRRGDLVTAESIALDTQRDTEAHFGKDSVKTRLVMSERIYILNYQQRTEEAFDIAEDVICRAQRHDGLGFPSERSIYEMEDLAEVCERLGKGREAVLWLRRALKGALNVWSNKEGTIHINNKLERLSLELETKGKQQVTQLS